MNAESTIFSLTTNLEAGQVVQRLMRFTTSNSILKGLEEMFSIPSTLYSSSVPNMRKGPNHEKREHMYEYCDYINTILTQRQIHLKATRYLAPSHPKMDVARDVPYLCYYTH